MRVLVFLLEFILFGFVIYLKNYHLLTLKKYHISAKYVDIVLSGILFLLSIELAFTLFKFLYKRRRGAHFRDQDNFIIGLNHLYSILVVFALATFSLALFNISIKALVTSLSIFAAAFSILFKDFISNLVSGMLLTFSNRVSIDDFLKIGNQSGKVVDMTMSSIHLLNDDDDLVFIPNNVVFSTEVTNYTKGDIKRISIDFEISKNDLSKLKMIEEELLKILNQFSEHVKLASAYLKIADIRSDSCSLKYKFSLIEANRKIEKSIRKEINQKVVELIS